MILYFDDVCDGANTFSDDWMTYRDVALDSETDSEPDRRSVEDCRQIVREAEVNVTPVVR